jgi:putative transcriptional regulator
MPTTPQLPTLTAAIDAATRTLTGKRATGIHERVHPLRRRIASGCYHGEVSESSLAPSLLVAMPQLLDPNFHRSVILLVHHDASGTFGVVLNRPTEINAPDLCATLEIEWKGRPDELIDWGGPVQPETGWVIFGDELAANVGDEAESVADSVFFARSLDVLRMAAQRPVHNIRLLLGYAGWGPGQLEGEFSQGAWLSAPVSSKVVFEVPRGEMWSHVVRSLGIEPATLVPSRGIH